MKRRMADMLVAGIAALVLLLGAIWSLQTAQRPTSMMNGSMGSMMDGTTGTTGIDPLVYLLGGVVVAVVIGGGYLLVRDQVVELPGAGSGPSSTGVSAGESMAESTESRPETEPEENSGDQAAETESVAPESRSTSERELLRYLPDDERRVLEPVIDSPGVTQIEIRDRSDFSKSKVSQTLSELEKRGLVAKEKQGRTFRVYPGEELADAESS